MKGVGKRGGERLERITWDEAISIVGDRLRHTIATYGSEAVYSRYGSGSTGYNFSGRDGPIVKNLHTTLHREMDLTIQ